MSDAKATGTQQHLAARVAWRSSRQARRIGERVFFALATCAMLSAATGSAAPPPITAAAFAPDGTSVAVGSQAGIELRSWPALTVMRRIDTRLANVHELAFAPTGALLAAAGGAPAESGACELFEWPGGRSILHRESHEDVVYSIAWQPDSLGWFTAGGDKRVIQQSLDGFVKQRFSGHSQSVLAVACLADGKRLVSAGRDRSLRVWDVADGQLVSTLNNHTSDVHDLAVRPESPSPLAMIASASADRTVRLWQPTIGRMVRFARLSSEPLAIDWTPSGDRLVAACRDGHLRVIDPATVEVIADIDAIDGWAYTVRVAPDGLDALVGGTDGQLRRVGLEERR